MSGFHKILLIGAAVVLVAAVLVWNLTVAGNQYGPNKSVHQKNMVFAQLLLPLIIIVIFGLLFWLLNTLLQKQ